MSGAANGLTPAGRSPTPFAVERLGVIWQADPTVAAESGGLLNPAAARGPHGALYLLPRVVGERNYSRISLARVRFDAAGRPAALERLGYALEPAAPYERRPSEATGGCEDPRVVRIAALRSYVMTYTAWSDAGPPAGGFRIGADASTPTSNPGYSGARRA